MNTSVNCTVETRKFCPTARVLTWGFSCARREDFDKAEVSGEHIIALTIINSIFSITGSLGNVFVCATIIKNPNLHIGTNYLVLNLSLGDLLVCLLVQPTYIFSLNKYNIDEAYFQCTYRIMAEISIYTSFHTLFSIAATRLKSLSRPFQSPPLLTKKRVCHIIIFIWATSTLMGTLSQLFGLAREILRYYKYVFNLVFIVIYARIFIIANHHFKRLSKLRKSVMFNHTVAKLKRENVTIRTTALIVGTFVVSFLPFTILKLAGIRSSTSEKRAAYKWAVTLIYCSSSYNPFIYFIRSEGFRKGLKRTLSSH